MTTVTLHYWRIFHPAGSREKVATEITVPKGPDLLRRAREALCVKCDEWNAQDPFVWSHYTAVD